MPPPRCETIVGKVVATMVYGIDNAVEKRQKGLTNPIQSKQRCTIHYTKEKTPRGFLNMVFFFVLEKRHVFPGTSLVTL